MCGGSQGIGEATARELAALDCRVVILARSEEKLRHVHASLPGEGHEILAHDLADSEGLAQSIDALLARLGSIQILINNTAGPKPGPITDVGEDTFLSAFHNHVLVSNLLTRQLLPSMKKAGYGRIINIISTSVKVPIANLGASNTIRGAMASWCKTLAGEVAPFGITANNVLPGFTATSRLAALIANAAQKQGKSIEEVRTQWRASVPAGRFAEPAEIGAAVAFLASPAAAYINGINLPVDGGRTGCL